MLYFVFSAEMWNMQSAAREHSRAIAQETDQLRKQLNEKESGIKRRSKPLNEIVAQTEMERRMLENERKRVRIYHPFVICYSLSYARRIIYAILRDKSMSWKGYHQTDFSQLSLHSLLSEQHLQLLLWRILWRHTPLIFFSVLKMLAEIKSYYEWYACSCTVGNPVVTDL